MSWRLIPRFHEALAEKELIGKLLYFTFLLIGLSFLFWCISLLLAVWRLVMRQQ